MTKYVKRSYQLLLRHVYLNSFPCHCSLCLLFFKTKGSYSDSLYYFLVKVLCKSHPVEFASYFHYCHSLTFDQRPDYGFLKRLFRELFTRQGMPKVKLHQLLGQHQGSLINTLLGTLKSICRSSTDVHLCVTQDMSLITYLIGPS